ncbi:MAG: asparagine synthase (glutamine-hydrolyzing) [Gemmatimonadales bacterium]|nr:MAG: asparagine synthase (glutamine-hydrolyzing) [Gemmatimonadales bacterium]
MCGIAGFVAPGLLPGHRDALRRALAALRHRGPDDDGTAFHPDPPVAGAPSVGLAASRLAILDLSPSGHQPMTSVDGRWTVAYNGEIYNYRELRIELERLGRRFRSLSDTEVLVEAFAEWGTQALARLSGMFALAIHDLAGQRLILARDPFGIKPLYYAMAGDTFVFASEIPAILEFPGLSRAVDPRHYHDFLIGGNTDFGGGTLFAAVRQLPAAHYLEVPLSAPRAGEPVRYWRVDLERNLTCSFDEAAALVRDAFLESMELHLRSDAPLGFALSGGIDSSAVVMAARHLLGAGAELHTFSYIPDEPRIDEEPHVDAVNRAAGAVGHKLRLAPEELRRDIERLSAVQGEPFASPVIYAQYRVLGLAKSAGVTVVLGGQGADEILAGYDRYFAARLASLLRQGKWPSALRALRSPVTPYPGGASAAFRSAVGLAVPEAVGASLRRLWRRYRGPGAWLDGSWFAERGVHAAQPWAPRGRRVLREMLEFNLTESQVQALMRYEDRSAMAFSVENRVPFLNPALVQLLFSLPEEYLLAADGTRKAVFRRAMRGIVPDAILDRRDKIGFSVPMTAWFDALAPWIAERVEHVRGLPGVQSAEIARQWRAVEARNPSADRWLVWRCVSLSMWAERFGATFV